MKVLGMDQITSASAVQRFQSLFDLPPDEKFVNCRSLNHLYITWLCVLSLHVHILERAKAAARQIVHVDQLCLLPFVPGVESAKN